MRALVPLTVAAFLAVAGIAVGAKAVMDEDQEPLIRRSALGMGPVAAVGTCEQRTAQQLVDHIRSFGPDAGIDGMVADARPDKRFWVCPMTMEPEGHAALVTPATGPPPEDPLPNWYNDYAEIPGIEFP